MPNTMSTICNDENVECDIGLGKSPEDMCSKSPFGLEDKLDIRRKHSTQCHDECHENSKDMYNKIAAKLGEDFTGKVNDFEEFASLYCQKPSFRAVFESYEKCDFGSSKTCDLEAAFDSAGYDSKKQPLDLAETGQKIIGFWLFVKESIYAQPPHVPDIEERSENLSAFTIPILAMAVTKDAHDVVNKL